VFILYVAGLGIGRWMDLDVQEKRMWIEYEDGHINHNSDGLYEKAAAGRTSAA
jgi:hypothetical protein